MINALTLPLIHSELESDVDFPIGILVAAIDVRVPRWLGVTLALDWILRGQDSWAAECSRRPFDHTAADERQGGTILLEGH